MITYIFIKGKGTHQRITGRIRHPYHLKVTLQTSVLPWSPMDCNVSEVKMLHISIFSPETEIVLIDRCFRAIREHYSPFASFHDGNIGIIFLFIKKRTNTLRTFQRNYNF